jgi:arylsulfatase A-like enzyme
MDRLGEWHRERVMKVGNRILILGCALMTCAAFASPAMAQDNKPNVVFFLVDNVGWGSFGVYGGTTPTPRIDQLANQGIRFNNYNVEAQCTPTRSAIHTGRFSVRSGTYTVPWPGQGPSGMSPWEYTIAKLFSASGYATALYGKWHLGEVEGRLPTDQGYDEWWGIENSWDEAGYTAWPLFKESGMKKGKEASLPGRS